MSPTSPNTTNNSIDETRAAANEGVSIVSAPKNVKFIIPLGRSGITSNESTFGVIESTTRTITHMKDIFPLNSALQSQTTTTTMISNGDDTRLHHDQNEITKTNNEQQPLLQNSDSNEQ
jgi:hypothetical protein